MDRKPVTGKDGKPSSNVVSAGYDPETKTFGIEFKDGSVYHHHDVPQHVYDGFMAADSKGSHYHANVKRFRHTKV